MDQRNTPAHRSERYRGPHPVTRNPRSDMLEPRWHDLGPVGDFSGKPLQAVQVGSVRLALTCRDGAFSAISGTCRHAGAPLGEGTLQGDYVTCPWHGWKYYCSTG